jgi:hypothetical protein
MELLVLARPYVNLRIAVARDELRPVIAVQIDGDDLQQRGAGANHLSRI